MGGATLSTATGASIGVKASIATECVVATEGVIAAQGAILSQGLIFGLSTGAFIGVLVGVALVAGIGYFVYKRYNPSPQLISPPPIQQIPEPQGIIGLSIPPPPNQPIIPIAQVSEPQIIIRYTRSEIQNASSISTGELIELYEELKCPLSYCLMINPTILDCGCGRSFSKHQIAWSLSQSQKCPLCDQRVSKMIPNRSLEKSIQRFRKKAAKKGKQWCLARISVDFENEIN